MQKREMIIYLLVAASSVLLISFTVHMFIGGVVDEETETNITLGVMAAWTVGLVGLGWDIKRKRGKR